MTTSTVPTVTPEDQRRKTCPVAKFGRPHVWITGAFYWPLGSASAVLYEGEDFSMCGACGQVEAER